MSLRRVQDRSGTASCHSGGGLQPWSLEPIERPAPLQVPGAEVAVYRVKDPVKGDDSSLYDDGVLDAEIATEQVGTALQAPTSQLVAVTH